MAQWCFDPLSSSLVRSVKFRMPYPKPDWYEERTWNRPLIAAMQHATEADGVFSKDPEAWGDEETTFYRTMLEGLADRKPEETNADL